MGIGVTLTDPDNKLEVAGDVHAIFGFAPNGRAVTGQSQASTGVFGQSDTGVGVLGISSGLAGQFLGDVEVDGQLTALEDIGVSPGKIDFGSTSRQMLDLFNTAYGIRVQSNAQYYRTASGFAWFKGGVHSSSTNDPGAGGTVLMRLNSAGSLFTAGTVNPPSDRNLKANFSSVNPRLILDRLKALPIQTWNYKADSDDVRHIGPVAQDFRAAFNLGADDKHISTVDADGVALAAIQGLYQLMLEKEKQNEQLTRIVAQQGNQIEQLREKLTRLERRSGTRMGSKPRRRR